MTIDLNKELKFAAGFYSDDCKKVFIVAGFFSEFEAFDFVKQANKYSSQSYQVFTLDGQPIKREDVI